jgi:uncharacterized protein
MGEVRSLYEVSQIGRTSQRKIHAIEPVIALCNGGYFNLLKPDEASFSIRDIASPLSKICRFTGHTNDFYSVAQHSVLVSEVVERLDDSFSMEGLMHDAAEAFIGDVSSPLKALLPEYRKIEAEIERVIFERYCFFHHQDGAMRQVVDHADLVLLKMEMRDLIEAKPLPWAPLDQLVIPAQLRGMKIKPWSHEDACERFVDRFEGLWRRSEKHKDRDIPRG